MTVQPEFDPQRALALARDTLDIEAQAVLAVARRLDEAFARAVRLVLACRGRLVVMGMGKSGHIGRKLTATLASTGTPAMFVHPAEASHGDLGMITAADVVLAISNSGESDELTAILPLIKRMGVPLLAITGRAESTLGRHADVVLDAAVDKEACPHNLAPTASTTAQLALGDALAVALLDARGFKPDDFARSHPGGALGRKLLTHVRDVMRSGAEAGLHFGARHEVNLSRRLRRSHCSTSLGHFSHVVHDHQGWLGGHQTEQEHAAQRVGARRYVVRQFVGEEVVVGALTSQCVERRHVFRRLAVHESFPGQTRLELVAGSRVFSDGQTQQAVVRALEQAGVAVGGEPVLQLHEHGTAVREQGAGQRPAGGPAVAAVVGDQEVHPLLRVEGADVVVVGHGFAVAVEEDVPEVAAGDRNRARADAA